MIWKQIEGFADYKVSNTGLVHSLKRDKLLSQYEAKQYMGVYLYSNGKRKFKLVHRLVALAFIPNSNNYPQINHKDEDAGNNSVDNLEWCTAKYNANYGSHPEKIRKRMLENNPFKGKRHSEEAKQKMSSAKIGKPSKRKRAVIVRGVEYSSVTEAMSKLKASTTKIYKLIKES